MTGDLVQLKPEIERAEQEFSTAVLNYLLILADDEATITGMRDTIIKYRSALEKLNAHLAAMSNDESPVPRAVIDQAIVRLRQRDVALKALLLRTRRILASKESLK